MTVVLAHSSNPAVQAAFDSALAQAAYRNCDLVILTVTSDDALGDEHLAGKGELSALLDRAKEAGVGARVERRLNADDADGILGFLDEVDAALVVLGIRHRSAVGKLLLGSTAQRVLMGATCDVLAVKAPR